MIRSLVIFVFALAGSELVSADLVSNGPFAGADLSKMPTEIARAVKEASEDFDRVARGEQPRFAEFYDPEIHEADDPRREHFLRFRGFHYSVFVSKVPVSFGDSEGIIFGPRIIFSQAVFKGWLPEVESTRFMTREELRALLRGDGLDGRWRFIPPPFQWPTLKEEEANQPVQSNSGYALRNLGGVTAISRSPRSV